MRFIDADKLYDTIQADKNNDDYWIEIDGILELIEKQEIVCNKFIDAYRDGYRQGFEDARREAKRSE